MLYEIFPYPAPYPDKRLPDSKCIDADSTWNAVKLYLKREGIEPSGQRVMLFRVRRKSAPAGEANVVRALSQCGRWRP